MVGFVFSCCAGKRLASFFLFLSPHLRSLITRHPDFTFSFKIKALDPSASRDAMPRHTIVEAANPPSVYANEPAAPLEQACTPDVRRMGIVSSQASGSRKRARRRPQDNPRKAVVLGLTRAWLSFFVFANPATSRLVRIFFPFKTKGLPLS